MALLLSPFPCLSAPSSSLPPPSIPIKSALSNGMLRRSFVLQLRSSNGEKIFTGLCFGERRVVMVHASAEVDGVGGGVDIPAVDGTEAVAVPIESLALESKERLKLEQKLRMKLAKKLRLRRKRLVMKRHLRKKGRWPPSKMKKNQNV